MSRKGRLTKKNKALAKGRVEDGDGKSHVPHSFIIKKGKVGRCVNQLKMDFRRVMEPNTAISLKERDKNTVKDFVSLSGPMNVSHLVMFTRTDVGVYLKMARMPRGPSLTFRLDKYSLAKDVISSLKKQMTYGTQFSFAPCLMTNLQSNDGPNHLQLVCRMFLDMFPTLSPTETKISSLRRCCLLNYDAANDEFDFRHYSTKVVPVGISKAVKKLIGNKVPDLGAYKNMAEYLAKAGINSESEGEEDTNTHVDIEKKYKTQKSSVKLVELGPRLTMKLIKVQDGLFDGTMLYHKFIHKTEEEKRDLEKKWAKKKKLKEKRKKEQNANVEKKKKLKEDHKKKCLDGMNLPQKSTDTKSQTAEKDDKEEWEDMNVEDDDADYYEQEVGEKPDADLFKKPSKRKFDKKSGGKQKKSKRIKLK